MQTEETLAIRAEENWRQLHTKNGEKAEEELEIKAEEELEIKADEERDTKAD